MRLCLGIFATGFPSPRAILSDAHLLSSVPLTLRGPRFLVSSRYTGGAGLPQLAGGGRGTDCDASGHHRHLASSLCRQRKQRPARACPQRGESQRQRILAHLSFRPLSFSLLQNNFGYEVFIYPTNGAPIAQKTATGAYVIVELSHALPSSYLPVHARVVARGPSGLVAVASGSSS